SAIEGGMSLFTTERNGQTSFQNLIHLNYSSLSTLIKICWDDNKTREWRDDILMKFLQHPHSISSKNRPNALYDAFSKADVL
ncbi:45063_t:CDS:1, partial [Gigaspora margarita]